MSVRAPPWRKWRSHSDGTAHWQCRRQELRQPSWLRSTHLPAVVMSTGYRSDRGDRAEQHGRPGDKDDYVDRYLRWVATAATGPSGKMGDAGDRDDHGGHDANDSNHADSSGGEWRAVTAGAEHKSERRIPGIGDGVAYEAPPIAATAGAASAANKTTATTNGRTATATATAV